MPDFLLVGSPVVDLANATSQQTDLAGATSRPARSAADLVLSRADLVLLQPAVLQRPAHLVVRIRQLLLEGSSYAGALLGSVVVQSLQQK